MKKKLLKQKEIKSNEKIFFTPRTEDYGCAEFVICPVFKYSRLKEVFIYPRQQPDAKEFFHIGKLNCDSFQIMSWTYKGTESPRIWRNYYCKEHKCVSFDVYPPKDTNYFYVQTLSILEVIFDREQKQ